MTPEEKFKEMAIESKASIDGIIDGIYDFAHDQAILWAYDRIKNLEAIRTINHQRKRGVNELS